MRKAVKYTSLMSAEPDRAQEVFDELTRLNHELLKVQKELAQRNSDLERLAYRDTLTGLLNRRSILEKLHEWLHHVRRYKGRLAVAMLDIDHFKQVNDLRGHRVGDTVLAEMAGIMRRSVRQTDFVGRYGGEEFLIVLPRTDAAGAAKMAERVRVAVQGTPMRAMDGPDFSTTVSLGVAEYCDCDDEDSLVGRADAALYRAKELGRNRVELSACP